MSFPTFSATNQPVQGRKRNLERSGMGILGRREAASVDAVVDVPIDPLVDRVDLGAMLIGKFSIPQASNSEFNIRMISDNSEGDATKGACPPWPVPLFGRLVGGVP